MCDETESAHPSDCDFFCTTDAGPLAPCIGNITHTYLSMADAVYMASVSMTSVGYGDLSPSGQDARLFSVFWILVGTLLTANAWGAGADIFLWYKQEQLNKKNLSKTFDARSVMKLDANGSGEVDEVEFVAHMLVKTQVVSIATLTDVRQRFKELDASGDGFIAIDDLLSLDEQHQAQLEQVGPMEKELVKALRTSMRVGSPESSCEQGGGGRE